MTDPTPTRDEAADFLRRLRAANVRRDAEYRAKTQGEPLPLLFRTTEFAGEVGELLNVVKKIERERLGWAGKRADRQMLLEEFGGVVATLDLLAMMLDVDLATATADEFNAVSDRLSLTTKLASAPAPASGGAEAVAVRQEAISLFHAFAAGVGYRDVSDRKLTREQADRWIKDSVADFTATLDRLASLSPAATQKDPADFSTGPLRDHDPVATAATPVSEAEPVAVAFPADGELMVMENGHRSNDFERWARGFELPLHMAESGLGRFYKDDRTEWAWHSWSAALAKPASSPAGGEVRRVRHKKRGTTYRVLHGAVMQSTHWRDTHYKVPADGRTVVVYQSEDDGSVWVRPAEEFEDGRFEALSQSASAGRAE